MFDKYEKIKLSGVQLFDITDLSIVLDVTVPSARVVAGRLVNKGVLLRLKRDLYMLKDARLHEFQIANKLITPSYVSFESALGYWGMTTQIPEVVTSAAQRSKELSAHEILFIYHRLPEIMFNLGTIKEQNFFIATPEKTLLDIVYYASLGRKSITFDDIDMSNVDSTKLAEYAHAYSRDIQKKIKEMLA